MKQPMKPVYGLAVSTCRELRRDKIFMPLLIAGACLLLLAHLISASTIEDDAKVFFDLVSLIFEVFGGVSALVWGSGLLGLSRSDAAWEVELVAPISRGQWVLGRFLGLAACLLLVGFFLAACVQGTMLLVGLAWLGGKSLWFLAAHNLAWLVLAALAVFFGSFCGKETALFATFSCWIAGLSTRVAAANLPLLDLDASSRQVLNALAWLWDLRYFTHDPLVALTSEQPWPLAVGGLLLYAVSLIALFLLGASLIVNQRDLSS